MNHELIRRLRYRLGRQGMLELDLWLQQFDERLAAGDQSVVAEVEALLLLEPPELWARMEAKALAWEQGRHASSDKQNVG